MSQDKYYYRQYRLRQLAGRKKLSAQSIIDAAHIQRLADDFQVTYGFRPKLRLKEKQMDEYTGHLLKHEGDLKDLQHAQKDHANDQNAHGHADRLQTIENKVNSIPDRLLDVLASLPNEVLDDLAQLLIDYANNTYDDGSNASKGKQNSTAK